jgi:hypothetical protein
MAEKAGEIQRETYYTILLPNGRKAELKSGVLKIWTRQGEELAFGEQDVRGMMSLFEEARKDRAQG